MMRMIRGRVGGAVTMIRDRLDNGLARAVTNVEGHRETSQGHIDRHVESARDAAEQMSRAFSDSMRAATTDAIKGFTGQRTQFAGHMTKLETGITHAFDCAVKNVEQSYKQQVDGIAKGNKDHAEKLSTSFGEQIKGTGKGGRADGLIASIKYYACVAARKERPAWEEIAKIVLIIVIAIVVSALLGPVVGAMVGAVGLAGAAATIVTAIIVGAIAGAVSSVAGQLFDNAMSGRRLGYGLAAAAKSGAISGAIGGFFGGVGAVFVKAASVAGASVLTKFAIQFTADMAAEYTTQVATNLMEGKSLGKSLTDINASGFIMAGSMSAGMFALHNVKMPGSKKTPPELPPGRDTKLSPRMQRAGAAIKAAETAIAESKPFKAAAKAGAATVGGLKTAATRLSTAFKGTRVGAALEASGVLNLLGRGGRSLLNLTGKLQDLNTTFGEKTTKLGEAFGKKLGIKPTAAEGAMPHEPPAGAKDVGATPHEAPAAPHEAKPAEAPKPVEAPAAPHEAPAAPHEAAAAPKETTPAKPTEADFKSVEATANKPTEQLTPGERLAEQRVAEAGKKQPVKEPFVDGGELPNKHKWGETADGKFCRYSNGACSIDGHPTSPPENMPKESPLKTDAPEAKATEPAKGTEPAKPGEPTAKPAEAAPSNEPRPASKPEGEPPLAAENDPLGSRHKLTKQQREYFRRWKKAAGTNEAELLQMRYERNKVSRQNRKLPPFEDLADWAADTKRRGTDANREVATRADEARPALEEHIGRKAVSGDRVPVTDEFGKPVTNKKGEPKYTKYEVEVPDVPTGKGTTETVTTKPDHITIGPDGKPDPTGVVGEHKHWTGQGKGEVGGSAREQRQAAAQRLHAKNSGGKRMVTVSADTPDLDGVPPRPRPHVSQTVNTEVLFVDTTSGRVTRRWNQDAQKWIPITPPKTP
jgi:hypothetical protein